MNNATLYERLCGPSPLVMGIVNVTPDSFYSSSRVPSVTDACRRACAMAHEGAAIIDVGACSTRPGSQPVDEAEELRRLIPALEAIREALPDAILSVDTFRPSVAAACIRRVGEVIVNDVSGGDAAVNGFPEAPYVLTCPDADPQSFFAARLPLLAQQGIHHVILDPGFGFGKTLDDNYRILAHLASLRTFGCPLLVGVSRKSMVYKPLGTSPDEALTGTTVLHTVALMNGATILRVHDVPEAVTAVRLLSLLPSLES